MKLAFRALVYAFECYHLLLGLIIKQQLYKFLIGVDFFKQFFAVVLKAAVSDESLLYGVILLCDELPYGHRH